MKTRQRRLIGLSAIVAPFGVVAAASVAWACVVQPIISIAHRSSGPAGSSVTLVGQSFNGPVELRWNAFAGPKLATANGPSFYTPIVIPHVSAGLYTIIALGRAADGSVNSTARAEFLVTGSNQSSPAPLSSHGVTPSRRSRSSPPSTVSVTPGLIAAVSLGGLVLLALGGLAGGARVRHSDRRGGARELGA